MGKAVDNLQNLGDLVPILQGLGKAHVARNVKKEHYPVVGQAVLDTVKGAIGEKWTPAVKKAWTIVVNTVATTMIGNYYDNQAMDDIMHDVMGSTNNVEKQFTQRTDLEPD